MSNVERLLNCRLFSSISKSEIDTVVKKCDNTIIVSKKIFSKDDTILCQGDKYNSLYILIKGIVSAKMSDTQGKVLKVEDLESESILSPATLFSSKSYVPVSVVAKSDCEIFIVSKQNFLKICMYNEKILLDFLKIISDRFMFISGKLNSMSFMSIKTKLIKYLLSLKKDEKGERDIPITIEELAELFAVERPSLSRALSELEKDKIIFRPSKKVVIIDKSKTYELF